MICAGRVWDPQLTVRAIEAGGVDLIGLERALWADPELLNELRRGEPENVRPAIGCNQGCIDRTDGRIRTCLLNLAWAREHECTIEQVKNPRRITVAGGGRAGLEVVRSAATRGHEVMLALSSEELGGTF